MTFKMIIVEVVGIDEHGHRHYLIRPIPYRLSDDESENRAVRTLLAQAFEQIPKEESHPAHLDSPP